ncbi:aminopeptidase [Peptoniphilus raoultii]|uniref:aminopeptidase n=1 Tax=Peptoniphilus raoultii TaxID=1776387 RepID=UPI0008DA458B|nr:aminopeptidase [Peptoniphilus raoultii]
MNLEIMFEKYAELIIDCALKVKKDDILVIRSPIESAELARAMAKKAYELGAKKVKIDYRDEKFSRLRFNYESEEILSDIQKFEVDKENYFIDNKAKYLSITGGNPYNLKGIDSKKIIAANAASGKAFKDFSEKLMANYTSWCVIGAAMPSWAKIVFPDLSEEEGTEKLWEEIFYSMRLFDENPKKSMEIHVNNLKKYSDFLNSHNFKYLYYKSKKGTDLKVQLPENYIFNGSSEKNSYGEEFIANVPSEEVFSLPHKYGVNGIIYNTKPLNNGGSLIDDFYLKFKDGKVIEFDAKKGYEELKGILESDEGSKRLGEVALVPFDSPISNRNILFYNTLYDENASCHFALGKAYPTCIRNGEDLDPKNYDKIGINDSIVHVDFMVGDESTEIIGEDYNGNKIQIFKNGNFAID